MNSKDKAFQEKFCVKKSSILTGWEIFVITRFSIMGEVVCNCSHQSKRDQISTHKSAVYQFFTSSPEDSNLPPLMLLEIEHQ